MNTNCGSKTLCQFIPFLQAQTVKTVENADDIGLMNVYKRRRNAVPKRISRARHSFGLADGWRRVIYFGCGYCRAKFIRG
jgi:hypothetical protein